MELPLTHAGLYQQLGIDPPRGVLLYGPPGGCLLVTQMFFFVRSLLLDQGAASITRCAHLRLLRMGACVCPSVHAVTLTQGTRVSCAVVCVLGAVDQRWCAPDPALCGRGITCPLLILHHVFGRPCKHAGASDSTGPMCKKNICIVFTYFMYIYIHTYVDLGTSMGCRHGQDHDGQGCGKPHHRCLHPSGGL